MFVVSVGSCLARRVAHRINGAKVVSAAYHNRSDVLFNALQSRGRSLKPLSDICRVMGVDQAGDKEFSPYSVISNQSREGFGLHGLPKGVPLIRALEWMTIDVIVVDNFMDHSSRLYGTEVGDYFCRYDGFRPPKGLNLGQKLSPAESASNFSRVVDVLRERQPKAKIAFIHFPTFNYPDQDRWQWCFDFRDALNLPADVLNILPRAVQPKYEGHDHQHFRNSEYLKYAREIENVAKGRSTGVLTYVKNRLVTFGAKYRGH